MKFSTTLSFLFLVATLFAAPPERIVDTLRWQPEVSVLQDDEGNTVASYYTFEGATYREAEVPLAQVSRVIRLDNNARISVRLVDARYESFDDRFLPEGLPEIGEDIEPTVRVEQARREFYATVTFLPFRRSGAGYERLVSYELDFTEQALPGTSVVTRGGETFTSVLSSGSFFKIATTETGIHRLSYDFLKDLGVDVDNIDPRQLKIYGNGGGLVPEANNAERIDDLAENPIEIVGEDDGSFDASDYVLFYAEGPDVWRPTNSDTDRDLFYRKNIYDTRNYYFVGISTGNGQRIEKRPAASGTATTLTSFVDLQHFEEDRYNVMYEDVNSQGSGKHFFGDIYRTQSTYTYDRFDFPNRVVDADLHIRARMVGKPNGRFFHVEIEGQRETSEAISGTGGSTASNVMNFVSLDARFSPSAQNPGITVEFDRGGNSEAEAHLDYLQVRARRELILTDGQMHLQELETHPTAALRYQFAGGSSDLRVWDVTDPVAPHAETISGSNFTDSNESLRRYLAFDGSSFLEAEAVGEVENQNVHAISELDFLIVYHTDFQEAAERLAQHRRDRDGMTVEMVEIQQVYNEFSSGRQDPTAIRDLARVLYERSDRFKYLLLLGDASFDPRGVYDLGGHFIPTMQTDNSFSETNAYPFDDYFGLLSPEEGIGFDGKLDIAVGRIPVRGVSGANTIIDKIIAYDNDIEAYGDWRNRVMFVADDEDGNQHIRDIETAVYGEVKNLNPDINAQKVYLDAFQQISTPGGTRVPNATAALNNNIFKGVLSVIYLGHGGPRGWTQERVLKIEDILSWSNQNKLPLFMTATCTFAGFDDPNIVTGGEEIIGNERGGAVALFSTVRPVYTTANRILTRATAGLLFDKENADLTMGEILRISKNTSGASTPNSRKFFMLGDPSQRLALPRLRVEATTMNGQPLDQMLNDTISALQRVTIAGRVTDGAGTLQTDFDGTVYPTVFDKMVDYSTLGQGDNTPFPFELQNNILFKGKASVTDGLFEFTFVVPKDINFNFGQGKLSFYAEGNELTRRRDASGSYDRFIVGGTDENALADDEGPKVDVYMNTDDFVFGGLTGSDPTLLVKLQDDYGINVAGTSIGHDLTGTLDEQTQNTYRLNDFYESELDDYTRGTVRYPLNNLTEGRHQISVRAWDVANNSGTGYTEFIVAADGKIALEHVLNYPNPFTSNTCFQFEHGSDFGDLDVRVQIFTVNGKLVKTLEERINAPGSRLGLDNCLRWDGRDEFGDELARGVYLYRVSVRTADGAALEGQSDLEKLVILK